MSNKKSIFNLGVTTIMLVALFLFMGCGGSKKYNWWEHYRTDSDSPYGTSVVFDLMDEYLSDEKLIIADSLKEKLSDEETAGTYFFLGHTLWLDTSRINAMLDFVERGNDVFIISSYINAELLDTLSGKTCIDLVYERDSMYYDEIDYMFRDSAVSLNLYHDDLSNDSSYHFYFKYRSEIEYYDWSYLPEDLFCEYQNEFVSLGAIGDSLTNFTKIRFGDGHFYFHTTPLTFTNFHIIRPEGREYAEKVFSHIDKAPILWDKTRWSMEAPSNRGFGNSPLKYVLSQPSLAWGWYILLGLAILYLLFRAKRRQRVIPVLEQNENTSLEFIKTIGRLYFIQSNHRQLALQKMKLFLGFIRDHYNLSTREINEGFKRQLSIKSEIPFEVIEKIFTIHENIERSKFTSENTLVAFHQEMERFYLGCK